MGLTSIALAEPPPKVEAGLKAIGQIVDPACTAALYRPFMPANDITSNVTPLYPGIGIARNQSFGSDPNDVADIFWGDKGPDARPVLIFLPGGIGDKTSIQSKAANAFYDNIGRWATKHGMVGVIMQRHAEAEWDGTARDFANLMKWLQDNIARYHGDASRMFGMGHSAGVIPLGVYIAQSDLWTPKGVGLIGAIFLSGQLNVTPVPLFLPGQRMTVDFARIGKTCGATGGVDASAGALPGVPPGLPGGPRAAGAMAIFQKGIAQGDPATQLKRSSLPGLKSTSVRLLLLVSEFDPPNIQPFNKRLRAALCEAGPSHCPTLVVAKGEGHVSEPYSFDSPDHTVSAPVLTFIHKTLAQH